MKRSAQPFLDELKRQGRRMTKVRAAIVEVLSRQELPLSVADITTEMKRLGLRPNKTTLYRELAFLVEAGLVVEVDLGEGKKRYESGAKGHHHHLICMNCHAIQDVKMDTHLTDQENAIQREHNFQVLRHALEFYGLCQRCQS